MVRCRHLYCIAVHPGYVWYLLPYQYGILTSRAVTSGYTRVVLPGFGWLGIRVQQGEELTIGKVLLPGACRVGRQYVVIVVSHEDVRGLHSLQEEVYLLFVWSAEF